jgi:hypothetical protein
MTVRRCVGSVPVVRWACDSAVVHAPPYGESAARTNSVVKSRHPASVSFEKSDFKHLWKSTAVVVDKFQQISNAFEQLFHAPSEEEQFSNKICKRTQDDSGARNNGIIPAHEHHRRRPSAGVFDAEQFIKAS